MYGTLDGMKRALPWLLAAIAFVAFVTSFFELQRVRKRLDAASRHSVHDHQDVRRLVITAALDGLNRPVVILGDSIVEMAGLPSTVCGMPLVNAGIGGASTSDFLQLAPRLLKGSTPSMIVVALGANDAGSNTVERDYTALLTTLKRISPRLLTVLTNTAADEYKRAAATAGVQLVEISVLLQDRMADGIHLNRSGYQKWTPALLRAIEAAHKCD